MRSKVKDHPNARRWLRPPTIEQVNAAVAKAGVSDSQFERYHEIYEGAIRFVRMGIRNMPVQHWHLFLGDGAYTRSHVVSKTPLKTPKQRTPRLNSTSSLAKLTQ